MGRVSLLTTLNLRTNKFNFYLSYSYSRKNDYDDLYVERSYLEGWRPGRGDRADDAIFLSNLEEYIKLLSFRDRLSNVG